VLSNLVYFAHKYGAPFELAVRQFAAEIPPSARIVSAEQNIIPLAVLALSEHTLSQKL
jgi:hypothetical protein